MNKTGIDLPGERLGIWFERFNQVELAVSAFGQTFSVTPIQHIAAVAAVANGGYLGTPHLLKATLDEEGNVVSTNDNTKKRQVISEETSARIVSYMEGGVNSGGSARNAYVKGYRVAAKTGTTVKTALRSETGETKYISSCVAFAPADDPQVAVMVLVDEPVGSYYGGTIAAPVASRVLADVLPYLGVEPQYDEEELETVAYNVDSYLGETVTDAKAKIIKDGYKCKVIGDGLTVLKQVPKAGDALAHDGTIVIYTDNTTPGKTLVPNVVGMTPSVANKTLVDAGLNITVVGTSPDHMDSAIAVTQSVASGETVEKGTVVTVDFRNYSNITD
jgi:stage V sporulation protein D (sporulation-specific penicillin-binding protein)